MFVQTERRAKCWAFVLFFPLILAKCSYRGMSGGRFWGFSNAQFRIFDDNYNIYTYRREEKNSQVLVGNLANRLRGPCSK